MFFDKDNVPEEFHRPCKCGSCEDAFEAALKLYEQSIKAGDCVTWRNRVYATLAVMAQMEITDTIFAEDGLPVEVAHMSVAQFGEWMRANSDKAEIVLAAALSGKVNTETWRSRQVSVMGQSKHRGRFYDVLHCDEVLKTH